ncbi:septum formation initiator family protein [Ruminiclostridium herbifermentans]|uniref:Septum formation initiator family protein n=1 Tax=Ruminiclostridium herbifermentans TaxID=2488810 RepID=A0A4V6ENT6_9FIRM|nr:septum formation initiator family protein [Ruminiclostridium herbifermentans]QNU67441.1 septum formation initiator family protein [Ruminiclostridium herbifermentans]
MKKQKKLKLLTYLVIISVCYFGYTLYTLQISIDEKELKNQELQRNINIETAKNQQLLKQKSLINTDEFYEQMAREKLGYIKDNEKIYIDTNK